MKKFFSFLMIALFATSMMADSFDLKEVNEVEAGKSYVFVHSGNAIIAEVTKSKLQSVQEFLTEGLEGTENYVWTLEKADGGFYMKTVEGKYLHNASKTDMSIIEKPSSVWAFTFHTNGVTIQNKKNDYRYIGETSSGSAEYKAYATSDMNKGHDFTAYELVAGTPSTAPSISAKKLDFGTKTIEEDATSFELDTTLDVTAKNLTEAISVEAEVVRVTETSLPAEGGKLHLHISAALGTFAGKVKLASGETKLEVEVVGVVKQKSSGSLPGNPIQMVGMSGATKATINGEDGFKVGSSKSSGSVVLVVPKGSTKLHFFAAAWNKEECTATLTPPTEMTISPSTIQLKSDAGLTGSDTDFTLTDLDLSDCRFDFELGGDIVNADKRVSITAPERFVIWGATAEDTPTAIDNTLVTEKAAKTFENGQLIIIKNGVRYNAQGAQL